MDHSYLRNQEENPRKSANFLSIVTFFYNFSILKKGRKNDLEEKDIYKVMPDYAADKLGDKLEIQWQKERKETEKASIIKCMIKCFGWTYFFYAVVQLVFTSGVLILQPIVFSKFVAYFQPGQTSLSKKDAYSFAFAIVGLNLLNTFFNNNFGQLVTEYSIKVRTAICSLIYRKALRMSPLALSELSIGKIVTMMSKDVFSIDSSLFFLKDMIIGFLQLAFITYLLYIKVGYSAFPAVAAIVVIIPIQLITGKKTTDIRIKTSKKTDVRFNLLQEALSVIKIIKMYTWENYFEKLINAARLKETDKIKVVYYLKCLILAFGQSTLSLAFYLLLVSYLARGYTIQAETVYFVQQCLSNIRVAISVSIPMGIAQTADMLATLSRVQTFLDADEIKPKDKSRNPSSNSKIHLNKVKLTIKNTEVLKSISFNLEEGLMLVTGNVGSGKSSLLKVILGEYPISAGKLEVEGSLSYATEEPWLFPSTIRQNILFGQEYDEKRYKKVLEVCALTYDINQFEKFDKTIVGDRGINLSKGQQARITLARAIYRNSDIYLLDDCLSSLDNSVNNHIFSECIRGFLKNKICILVTNNINNIRSMNNKNVLFIENGTTLTLEQQEGALDKRITYYMDEETEQTKRLSKLSNTPENFEVFSDEVSKETDQLLPNQEIDEGQKVNLYYEKNKEGGVAWSVYFRYYQFIGGAFVMFYLFVVFGAAQFATSYSEKLISLWVNLEPKISGLANTNGTNSTEYIKAVAEREQYFNLYTMLLVAGILLLVLRSYSSFFFCMNGGRRLHKAMVTSMIRAYMYFFDNHFIGNIINRLSKDFHAIDEYIPYLVFDAHRNFFMVIGVIALVASVNVGFFIPAGLLLIKLYFIQRLYLPTGRSLRRLEASIRSPIIGYLNSTLEGIAIARAAQQESILKKEFDRHQDQFTSVFYTNQSTLRFFSFLLDIFGTFFIMGIIMKFVFFSEGVKPGDVGLALSQAMTLSFILQYVIKQIAEVENAMTAIERVLEYVDVPPETKIGKVLTNWPTEGTIRYNDVSLTYKSNGNPVLKNINFEFPGKSKIGIVGRTGAGKSSIISTLFRLYEFEGHIMIDNENIKNLSLEYLRSSISIIPQDPVLFSGTIRTNIDPFHKHSDAEIWNALDQAHIKKYITNLNTVISDLTDSYSSGQKQLLCLARAIVQANKVVVLDEATANLDPETDQLLQKTVKECFENCTVIIIAHRLHTVMSCDKVLVMDAGRIVEFDEPDVLLQNKDGILYHMVKSEKYSSANFKL